MKQEWREVLCPVLLGGDLNCYSMARALYERYGVVSRVFGRERLGATQASRFLRFTKIPALSDTRVLEQVLVDFAEQTPGKTRLLLAGTDEYARAVIAASERLESRYILPFPDTRALPYFEKEAFYQLCETWHIPYPQTVAVGSCPSLDAVGEIGNALGWPLIIKPSSSIAYWHYPFEGMEKVYTAYNRHGAYSILETIFASGYPGRVLLQKYMPGGDTAGMVLTMYFDRTGRPVMRAAGRVLLEERTPRGRGNYAALLTCRVPEIAERLAQALGSFGYCGFANFDLRTDERGDPCVLELNLRPGRSNHFLAASGCDPARLLVEDCLLGNAIPPMSPTRAILWRTVPYRVLRDALPDGLLKRDVERLHAAGHEANPWDAPQDLRINPRRWLYVLAHRYRERQKFASFGV